jgi:RNA polymerase sigma-70 factor, ECF subfamily
VDRRLVERAIEGDRDAFASLALLVSDSLYAVAYRILRDPGLAEDALQNTLVMAWRHLDGLRDPDRFEAWIRRVLVHASYAEARRRGRETATVRRISMTDELVDDGAAVIDRDEIERAFRRLSAEHRAIFVLHYYLGLPLVDIASTLGIPDGTARSRLHYAIRALRALMQPDRMATLEEVNLA